MKTLSYQTFLSFYNENKNKLFMPVSGNRSINDEHVNIWYDNIEKYSLILYKLMKTISLIDFGLTYILQII